MMSAAVAGPTFRPTPSYTTLRDVTTCLLGMQPDHRFHAHSRLLNQGATDECLQIDARFGDHPCTVVLVVEAPGCLR